MALSAMAGAGAGMGATSLVEELSEKTKAGKTRGTGSGSKEEGPKMHGTKALNKLGLKMSDEKLQGVQFGLSTVATGAIILTQTAMDAKEKAQPPPGNDAMPALSQLLDESNGRIAETVDNLRNTANIDGANLTDTQRKEEDIHQYMDIWHLLKDGNWVDVADVNLDTLKGGLQKLFYMNLAKIYWSGGDRPNGFVRYVETNRRSAYRLSAWAYISGSFQEGRCTNQGPPWAEQRWIPKESCRSTKRMPSSHRFCEPERDTALHHDHMVRILVWNLSFMCHTGLTLRKLWEQMSHEYNGKCFYLLGALSGHRQCRYTGLPGGFKEVLNGDSKYAGLHYKDFIEEAWDEYKDRNYTNAQPSQMFKGVVSGIEKTQAALPICNYGLGTETQAGCPDFRREGCPLV